MKSVSSETSAKREHPPKRLRLERVEGQVLLVRMGEGAGQGGLGELVEELGAVLSEVKAGGEYKSIVLASEYEGFLPCGEPEERQRLGLQLRELILESAVPVIAALSGGAGGVGWFVSQYCEGCIYSREGRYTTQGVWQGEELSAQATMIFAHRWGNHVGKELLLRDGQYTGKELGERVGGLKVVESDRVLSEALELGGRWGRGHWDAVVSWKSREVQAIREKGRAVRVWERESAQESEQEPSGEWREVQLSSRVITASVHEGGIVVIRMQDRQAKNMFSEAFVEGIREVFAHIGRSVQYKAVVLTGYDSYFASGGTKESLRAIQDGRVKFTDFKIFQLAMECPIPVIAALQGHGIGAGWSLGMFADVIVLSEESQYVSPYMNYGFTPGAGATMIFPQTVGYDLARETLLTGQEYEGRELRDRGLRLVVLPRERVLEEAMRVAREIVRGPRARLKGIKGQLTRHLHELLEEAYRLELAMHERTFVGQTRTLQQIEEKFLQAGVEPAVVVPERERREEEEGGESGTGDVLAGMKQRLKQLLAQELHMQEGDIEDEARFVDLGLDSISGVTWVRKINEAHRTAIEATKIYSYPTLNQLARHVHEEAQKQSGLFFGRAHDGRQSRIDVPAELSTMAPVNAAGLTSWRSRSGWRGVAAPLAVVQAQPAAIAVIGMAGQFAQAKNLQEYWQNIAQGRDCVTPVGSRRWDVDAYYRAGEPVAGKTNSRWLGELEEYDLFDPLFFNLSPTEAQSMDPQQRLFLQACWHSVEHAGYSAKALSGSKCGVFAGCTSGDYHQLSEEQRLSAQGFTGGASSILAARISYFLNLQGPCVSIDTACSSSLVAMAQACDSLVSGGSDVALAGGVYVMAGAELHIKTAQAGMLSPQGRCFTFDQRADGFVPGEGVGVVMLKRLSDAQRDQDVVYAVIQGWGVNQDGKTNGITAPNPESQTRLQRQVYERYGIDPANIEMLEAHGTGTKLGDPIEVEGLKGSFGHYTQKEGYCALGSVKSNIGHCLTAAGVAGAIKLIMALRHRQLPPTINFEQLNEHIGLKGSPFYINRRLQEWPEPATLSRQAAISSFGFSGTNAHMVMGEYREPREARPPVATLQQEGKLIVPLSARTKEQLQQKARDLVEYIRQAPHPLELVQIAYTLQVGREPMGERLGVMAGSTEQLVQTLQAYVRGEKNIPDLCEGQVSANKDGMSIISRDDDMRASIIENWIAGKKLSKLLDLWVKGLDLDWNSLYGENKPARIELPLYPFAKEHYWIDASDRRPTGAVYAALAGSLGNLLHPLLHTNTSDLKQLRYSSTFSGQEFFLADHQVRLPGHSVVKVLPGAAYLEMARAAVTHAAPARQASNTIEMRNVVWLQPMVASPDTQVTTELFAPDREEEYGETVEFEICGKEHKTDVVYCQGQIAFGRQQPPTRLDIDRLRSVMTQDTWDSTRIYALFSKMGLIYGPAHKVIQSILLGQRQLLARLSLPPTTLAGENAFILHPSMMDGALQATIGLIAGPNSSPTNPSVPFVMDYLRIMSACRQEMTAWVRYSPVRQSEDKVAKFDIDLCNLQGDVCVQMRGVLTRTLESEIHSFNGKLMNGNRHELGGGIRPNFSFDNLFYQQLIGSVINNELTIDQAVDLG